MVSSKESKRETESDWDRVSSAQSKLDRDRVRLRQSKLEREQARDKYMCKWEQRLDSPINRKEAFIKHCINML